MDYTSWRVQSDEGSTAVFKDVTAVLECWYHPECCGPLAEFVHDVRHLILAHTHRYRYGCEGGILLVAVLLRCTFRSFFGGSSVMQAIPLRASGIEPDMFSSRTRSIRVVLRRIVGREGGLSLFTATRPKLLLPLI